MRQVDLKTDPAEELGDPVTENPMVGCDREHHPRNPQYQLPEVGRPGGTADIQERQRANRNHQRDDSPDLSH